MWMPHSDVDAPGLGEAKPSFTPREFDQLCECPALYKTRSACGVRHKGDGGALPGWEQHWQSTEQNSQIEPWHRLPREVLEFTPLEMFERHLDMFLGNWL